MPYSRSDAISERHETLLDLVERGGFSATALAHALGVSEATINRDLSYLREKGHVIRACRVDTGWAFTLDTSDTAQTSKVNGRA